ncbi:transcriptional regulator [Orbus mooreae]|uniref:transcriptional regulator n=1 Tax=Orbus mooreae TaxID=3074107 RepID=UPI00370D72C2
MNKKNTAIGKAIDFFGSQSSLAKELDVTRARVWQWFNNVSMVSPEKSIEIEGKTKGMVRCEELRPDINWSILRNKKATNAN